MTALAERSPRVSDGRLAFADGARGFMILLMLVGHADPPKLLFKLIYGFHMPFFFLLSGYLYHAEKYAHMRFPAYCKVRFRAYVIPYFLYAFCNLLVNIPLEVHQGVVGKALLASTARHVFWIFYAIGDKARTPNCTPLWFLPCLFLCCLLFYGLQRIPKESLRWAVCGVFCAAAFLLSEMRAAASVARRHGAARHDLHADRLFCKKASLSAARTAAVSCRARCGGGRLSLHLI